MNVVPGGNGSAVESGWLVVPAAQRGFDLLVDAVADGLHDLGFNDGAIRINRHLNDDIPNQVVRQVGAVDGRIGIDGRIGYVDFISGDGAVDQGSKRRSGVRVVIAGLSVSQNLLRSWSGLGGFGVGALTRFFRLVRVKKFSCVGRKWSALWSNVDQSVRLRPVSVGEPFRSGVEDPRIVKDDDREQREVRGDRSRYSAIPAQQ